MSKTTVINHVRRHRSVVLTTVILKTVPAEILITLMTVCS